MHFLVLSNHKEWHVELTQASGHLWKVFCVTLHNSQSASMMSNVSSCEKFSYAMYFYNMQELHVFDFILPKRR